MRLLVALLLLSAPLLAGCAENPTTPPTAATGTPPNAKECTSGSNHAAQPTWVLKTTKGTIRITLFCDKAPITTQNIVTLTQSKYFDGSKFHRVIKDFMDQGGDPLTKDDSKQGQWGTGGPGYTIKDEFYCADGSVSNTLPASCPTGLGLKHEGAGVLSMANTGRPETGGSQFFMTAVSTPWLDGKHPIFGHTADDASTQVVLDINHSPTASGDRPNPPIALESATIEWG
ncbi:MAG TPA: peptidylprolyl isomerase [Candidatus Thermoplasmatota archaeon]|nr:peptidylprolyl isomerase [Candidatus Thermoplasmatota archaeon]